MMDSFEIASEELNRSSSMEFLLKSIDMLPEAELFIIISSSKKTSCQLQKFRFTLQNEPRPEDVAHSISAARSPDRHPVLRSEVHVVSLRDPVKVEEFVILLQCAVGPQIVHGMRIVDTGISGFAAGKVGKQLAAVSKTRQVICVTHLAQIASCGTNHLKIEKKVMDNRTFTEVKPLSFDDRIAEIARIMSGTEITENLYNSAKELLDRS